MVISEGQSSGNVTGYKKIMREESHTNNKNRKPIKVGFQKSRCMGILEIFNDGNIMI